MTTRTVQRWTVARQEALILEVLRGERSLEDAAVAHELSVEQLVSWRERFLAGGRRALQGDRARRVCDSIADAVGETPLVRLSRVIDVPGAEVFAKVEFMNPMGSIKDRVARHMVRQAALDGRLAKGDVIVESSSGNTALGLGMMARLGGYRCKVAVRDRTSAEKINALEALGVEVVLVQSDLPPEHPESYNRVMERIVRETPDCYFPDQHNNRENNQAHYLTTGPEIWEQMEGRIDVFVAGVGTGGTIGGVARYLKEKDPSIHVVGVDPVGSIFSEYFRSRTLVKPGPYLLEGLGDEEPIECVEFDLIDDFFQIQDEQAFRCARELASREAIFAGGSSGAALWAVRQALAKLGRPARVATVFPDSGHRYLSTIYNDAWLASKGFEV